MNHNKYITSSGKKEHIKTAIVILVLFAEVALGAWEITRYREPTGWDISYPMINANVSWSQTFYPGAMPHD